MDRHSVIFVSFIFRLFFQNVEIGCYLNPWKTDSLKLCIQLSLCLFLLFFVCLNKNRNKNKLISWTGSCAPSWWISVDSFEAGDGPKATIATNERMSNCATLSSWIKDKAMAPSLVDSQVWKLVVRLWDAFIVSWLNISGWESQRPCCWTGYTFLHKNFPTFTDKWGWVSELIH